MDLNDIHIRDPFILPVQDSALYYMYGTSVHLPNGTGFDAYRSADLRTWEGPFPVFRPEPDFWADRDFWAPEVHRYKGRYYLLGSFKTEGVSRGTQILTAENPEGPFRVHSEQPITPPDWECLDGTLFVDDDEKPWMVFCHEWLQINDGAMAAVEMDANLKQPVDEPVRLFRASEAPWTVGLRGPGDGIVTDGPFLHRPPNGEPWMLWSSFTQAPPELDTKTHYAVGLARSASGSLQGSWKHDPAPVYHDDGGHPMLFRRFDGTLMLSLHSPNTGPYERPRLFEAADTDGELRLLSWP